MTQRLTFDVVVVGAGPAGLATAWWLAAGARGRGLALNVAVVEKAARVGGHLLSGALINPVHLTALTPGRTPAGAPPGTPVTRNRNLLLTPRHAWPLPRPRAWGSGPCSIFSLGEVCRWLARECEGAGVAIFPGTPAVAPLWTGEGVGGVVTGELGRRGDGSPGPGFQEGVELAARVTVLAEGCRGSVTGEVVKRFGLHRDRSPQTYGLGLKGVWRVPGAASGEVWHTLGWPLDRSTHGGGFVYGAAPERVAAGLVVALDYADPALDPWRLFQSWLGHPAVSARLEGGELLAYGARTLVEGGWQALPRLVFPGGVLVGDGAGFLDAARLQGVDNALASGRLAAEAILEGWPGEGGNAPLAVADLAGYPTRVEEAEWFGRLHAHRNVRPGFRAGRWWGVVNAGWEGLTGGRSPWSWRWRRRDREMLRSLHRDQPLPDDREAGAPPRREEWLARSGVREPGGPSHLRVGSRGGGEGYGYPETRFCPAGVYQLAVVEGESRHLVHHRNCLHCKCCDLKDPLDGITWTPPEGGSGPDFAGL